LSRLPGETWPGSFFELADTLEIGLLHQRPSNPKENNVKKSLKKFMLNRETLLSLDRVRLQEAAGGISANTDCTYTNCCSGINTCGTGCGGGGTTGGTTGTRLC
jgi:hypothetical protein